MMSQSITRQPGKMAKKVSEKMAVIKLTMQRMIEPKRRERDIDPSARGARVARNLRSWMAMGEWRTPMLSFLVTTSCGGF